MASTSRHRWCTGVVPLWLQTTSLAGSKPAGTPCSFETGAPFEFAIAPPQKRWNSCSRLGLHSRISKLAGANNGLVTNCRESNPIDFKFRGASSPPITTDSVPGSWCCPAMGNSLLAQSESSNLGRDQGLLLWVCHIFVRQRAKRTPTLVSPIPVLRHTPLLTKSRHAAA